MATPYTLLLAIAILSPLLTSSCYTDEPDQYAMRDRYEEWIIQYSRNYTNDIEKEQRFEIYQANARLIDTFNSISKGYKLADNQFADLTNTEFRDKYSCIRSCKDCHTKERKDRSSAKKSSMEAIEYDLGIPLCVDWRNNGSVTPIKNQGSCGSCWAFSAVAAVEGLHSLKNGELTSLSEQELIDCDTAGGNSGCLGGVMTEAFSFIKRNGGITTEAKYPYQGTQGTCDASSLPFHAASIGGYKNVKTNSEEELLKAAAGQPVSVGVDAGGFGWQFYSEGIFSGPCGSGTNLNHGVTVVGYGSEGSDKYWIVKNSWGTLWGEEGYVRIKRETPDEEGMCGIAMMGSYPVE